MRFLQQFTPNISRSLPSMSPSVHGLMRHAITGWNQEKRIQGQRDIPLSTTGQAMAHNWALQMAERKQDKQDLPAWDMILSSPLQRTRQTADILSLYLDIPVHTCADIMEQDWGEWTGHQLRALRKIPAQKAMLRAQEEKGWNFCPPGGESRLEVLKRSLGAIYGAALKYEGKNILFVTHQGVIKCLLYHFADRQFMPHEPSLLKPYHLHLLYLPLLSSSSPGKTCSAPNYLDLGQQGQRETQRQEGKNPGK